jgi:hypothetical protein
MEPSHHNIRPQSLKQRGLSGGLTFHPRSQPCSSNSFAGARQCFGSEPVRRTFNDLAPKPEIWRHGGILSWSEIAGPKGRAYALPFGPEFTKAFPTGCGVLRTWPGIPIRLFPTCHTPPVPHPFASFANGWETAEPQPVLLELGIWKGSKNSRSSIRSSCTGSSFHCEP